MLLEVAMETIIPLLMASIIDEGVNKGDTHHIYVMGIWMIFAALFALICGCLGAKYGSKKLPWDSKKISARLCLEISRHIPLQI